MKIFLIRAEADLLTASGKMAAQKVTNFLKRQDLNIHKTKILTLEIPQTIGAARTIKDTLGIKTEIELLSYPLKHTDNFQWLRSYITHNDDLENLIIVGRLKEIGEILEDFARFFKKFEFSAFVENGSVHLVDIETKQIQELFLPSQNPAT